MFIPTQVQEQNFHYICKYRVKKMCAEAISLRHTNKIRNKMKMLLFSFCQFIVRLCIDVVWSSSSNPKSLPPITMPVLSDEAGSTISLFSYSPNPSQPSFVHDINTVIDKKYTKDTVQNRKVLHNTLLYIKRYHIETTPLLFLYNRTYSTTISKLPIYKIRWIFIFRRRK